MQNNKERCTRRTSLGSSVEKLNGKTMMMYARMLYYGEATNKDLKKSLYYYKNAIQHGCNIEDNEYQLLLKKEEEEEKLEEKKRCQEEKNEDNSAEKIF